MPSSSETVHHVTTHYGTLLFLDPDTLQVRHGPIESSPWNLLLVQAGGTACLTIDSNGISLHIHLSPGSSLLRDQPRCMIADHPQVFQVVEVAAETFGLASEGFFLCAEPDGQITLSRPSLGMWEQFKLAQGPPAPGPAKFGEASKQRTIRMASGLVHITVGHPRRFLMDLLEECSHLMGCRFVAIPKHWSAAKPFSLFEKFAVLRSYLDSGEVGLDDIVLFTDAYDVLLAEHGDTIVEKFQATGADIVFSAESTFYPSEGRDSIKQRFEVYDSKWRYLNSGGYIGYGWAVKALVDYCAHRLDTKDYELSTGPNDQPLVQEFYLAHRDSSSCRAYLDTAPEIFASLNTSFDDFVVSRSRVRVRKTGRTVSVLHANAGKQNLDSLVRFWALQSGAASAPGQFDLRIATIGDQVLGYSPEQRKLIPVDPLDPSAVVFAVKGNRHAVALSAAHGLLTFAEHGAVHAGAEIVNLWEVVKVRDDMRSYHNTDLGNYATIAEDATIGYTSPTLSLLLQPSFDALMKLMKDYAWKL